MSISRNKINTYLDNLLRISEVFDYSCNGLQCEGVEEVKKIGLAVDACMKVYEQAKKKNCEMVIVHHGFIWGGIKSISGPVYKQVKFLIQNGINLYAAHLPLDMNEECGNNIQLAKMIKLSKVVPFGKYEGVSIGFSGELKKAETADVIANIFQKKLGGKSLILPFGKKKNKSVAIVSGGASKTLNEAIEKNIDCLITGESSHQDHYAALEGKINVIYLGHYHSEQLGVKAVGEKLKKKFGVKIEYLDEPTVV